MKNKKLKILKAYREKQNITLENMAKNIGIPPAMLAGIERGYDDNITEEIIPQLLKWYEVEGVSDIEYCKDEQPPPVPETILSTTRKNKSKRKRIPREVRKEVLKRDKYACYICGSKENLVMHHIKEMGKGGSNDKTNLITLCVPCHYVQHPKIHESFSYVINTELYQ